MVGFNRIVITILCALLMVACLWVALNPIAAAQTIQEMAAGWVASAQEAKAASSINFLIGQIAFGVGAVVLFALLIWLQVSTLRRRGVRIYTADGGSAELDTDSVGRRLSWRLDQLAELVTVLPVVRPRGSAVDIRLDIEAAPDVDIPMKTEEVVQVTRDIIEDELGLRMGKLDIHMRCAPFQPDWT